MLIYLYNGEGPGSSVFGGLSVESDGATVYVHSLHVAQPQDVDAVAHCGGVSFWAVCNAFLTRPTGRHGVLVGGTGPLETGLRAPGVGFDVMASWMAPRACRQRSKMRPIRRSKTRPSVRLFQSAGGLGF